MAKICLDAGHYGNYNRSPAIPEYWESRMNWKLQGWLKAELEKLGHQVITTRSDPEKDLPLVERGKKSQGCDLFLSLHSNAAGSGVYEKTDYVVAHVQLDGRGDQLGLALAQTVAQLMATQQAPRIAKREGASGEYYGVLRGAASVGTPGIILEHSFHTQTRATRWLLEEENLQALAREEAEVISTYFQEKAAPDDTPVENRWYRIRKRWDDPASQLGAYRDLDMAIADCPIGYKVYDWHGHAVYPKADPARVTVEVPVLLRGDRGSSVKALQRLLQVSDDSIFGPETENAVKSHQINHGLAVNGICDEATWGSLVGV